LEKKNRGTFVRLSEKRAAFISKRQNNPLTYLKMNLKDVDEKLSTKHFYGKVVEDPGTQEYGQLVQFTSVPPEVAAHFQAFLQHSVE